MELAFAIIGAVAGLISIAAVVYTLGWKFGEITAKMTAIEGKLIDRMEFGKLESRLVDRMEFGQLKSQVEMISRKSGRTWV